MTTQNTTVEIRENAYGTTPIFGWGWPDEARLAAFAEETIRTEKNDREEEAERMPENSSEYAALYFVS